MTALSIFAFLISAVSLYFNVIQRTDDVSLVFTTSLSMRRGGNDEVLLDKAASYPIVLINSGNRAVSISEISMLLFQHNETPNTDCSNALAFPITFDTDFEAMVLKEREVVNKQLKLVAPSTRYTTGVNVLQESFHLPMRQGLTPLDEYVFEVCLEIKLSTPSVAFQPFRVPVAAVNSAQGGLYADASARWHPRPLVVIKKWGTVFNY